MTFQISILFTNGRTIRKVMGGGGWGGGVRGKKTKKQKIRATENVREKNQCKEKPPKKGHNLDGLH